MEYTYRPKGVCSSMIKLDIEDDIIKSCKFIGGCAGNTQGVSKLVTGRNIKEVADLLKGIQCRGGTSCPDQLSKALYEIADKK